MRRIVWNSAAASCFGVLSLLVLMAISRAEHPRVAQDQERARADAKRPEAEPYKPSPKAFVMEALPLYIGEQIFLPGRPQEPSEGDERSRAVIPDTRKLWPTGYTIKISFIGGDPQVRKRIADIASDWQNHANLSLDFGRTPQGDCRVYRPGDDSHVRISFAYPGYWSLIGTDCINSRPNEPTMNFQFFDTAPPDTAEFQSTVLHEFGHALGLSHEHQNPNADCEYDWPAIYRYLSGPPNSWDTRTIDRNMKQLTYFDNPRMVATGHDPASIMHYAFPAQFFKNPNSPCSVAQNTRISATDKSVIAAIYPGKVQGGRSPGEVSAERGLALDESKELASPEFKGAIEARLQLYTGDPSIKSEIQRRKDLGGLKR